ncbi:MAG: DUF4976 domain-containing protein, partial [Gemmatimonadales bacterium]
SNAPLRAGKGWLYEGGIRAPLLVKWPGVTDPGAVVDAVAVSHDLYPTLLAMANLPLRPQQHVDGVNLVPLLRALGGGADLETAAARDTVLWHFPHYHGSGNRPSAAIRAGDWKLVHWFEDGSSELYDLRTDLGELENVAAAEPDLVSALEARLQEGLADMEANLPTPMGGEAR